MMHLFINSLAATAGGGLTYIRNVIPYFAGHGLRVTVALGPSLREEFRGLANVEFLELEIPTVRRFWYEQRVLPEVIRQSGADILLSTGNFALRKSPVPQILLSRNSIYTSPDFSRDLRSRREYRAWLDMRIRSVLAKKSIHWADVTVAPSEAFAAELKCWTGTQVISIHHGFDWDAFTQDPLPIASEINEKLRVPEGSLKLLFVSHYNYYRNFETLIRALPILRARLAERSVKLFLTCQLSAGKNPGAYCPDVAANLVKTLGVSDMVIELGAIPYRQLHRLYASVDLYVSPAYTETFAHPLVEAMAGGVPLVISDIPVHREICRDAALYFKRFSPEDLTERVVQAVRSPDLRKHMAAVGLERSHHFSWKAHVDQIVDLSHKLMNSNGARAAGTGND